MMRLMLMILLFLFVRSGFSQDFELDTREALEVIKKWNFATNAMNESTLREIYGDQLIFYSQDVSKENAIARKRAFFNANRSFRQKITSDPKFKAYTSGVVKADFLREVFEHGRWRPYNSYLLISYEKNRYLILAESDLETDRKNNYKLSIGKVMDIPQKPAAEPREEPLVAEPIAAEPRPDPIDTLVMDTAMAVAQNETTTITKLPVTEDSVIASVKNEVLSDETVAVPKKYVYFLIGFVLLVAIVIVFSKRPKKSTRRIKEREKPNEPLLRKEKAFESFVVRHFDPHYFTLKSNTPEPVFAGNVNVKEFKPNLEIEFQSKDTHVRLAIECIFIPQISSRELLSYSANQVNRYHDFEENYGTEVYLIVGLEGEPGDPKELFLIPTSDLHEGYYGYKDLQAFKKHGMFFYNSVRRRLL